MTAYTQIYCTTAEIIKDLRLSGDEPGLLDRIRMASRYLLNMFGNFIPVSDSRIFYPDEDAKLFVDALLAASSVTNDTTVTTAYTLQPPSRLWPGGPYLRLKENTGEDAWSSEGVTIVGRWGLYEETKAVNVSSVSQLLADTTLAVSNGSQLSPGMTLLIGTEQELVTAGNGGEDSPAATAATSLLNGAVTADDEDITVDNGSEFKQGEVIQVGTEDLYIRKIGGNVLACSRGWNGTTKALHANDSGMAVYRTFTVDRGINGTTAAAHTTAAVSRYIVPEDVNWLTRQVAGLMRMKAAVGFASKSGNSELGEVFYFNEFPAQIQKIRNQYFQLER